MLNKEVNAADLTIFC